MNQNNNNNNIDWGGWVLTVVMLGLFWPVGLVLLFRQLMGYGRRSGRTDRGTAFKRHPYDLEQERRAAEARGETGAPPVWETSQSSPGGAQTAETTKGKKKGGWEKVKKTTVSRGPVDVSKGKILTIIGAGIAATFGIGLLSTLGDAIAYGPFRYYIEDLIPLAGFFGGGLVCLYAGRQRQKKAKRYKKYLAYIGRNTEVSLHTLASAMGVRERTVYDDLQDMLDSGVLPVGYIDVSSGKLVLSDEGISEPKAERASEEEPAKEEKDENAILQEIREVNDAIPDEIMSAKIDRIGEITSKILDYQRKSPNKSRQLRSFLNYYLPTTLKVLRAYAQLDAQGIEGENINAAKARIEGMMDQVVAGFEKQLDKLFQDDALDIKSDVEVLENMLKKDGLADDGMNMGSFSSGDTQKELERVIEDLNQSNGQGLTLGG